MKPPRGMTGGVGTRRSFQRRRKSQCTLLVTRSRWCTLTPACAPRSSDVFTITWQVPYSPSSRWKRCCCMVRGGGPRWRHARRLFVAHRPRRLHGRILAGRKMGAVRQLAADAIHGAGIVRGGGVGDLSAPALHRGLLQLPDVIPTAGIITALLFGGLTMVAFTTGHDFSFLGGLLKVGGFVALGVIVASILFGFSLGLFFVGLMILFRGGAILYKPRRSCTTTTQTSTWRPP